MDDFKSGSTVNEPLISNNNDNNDVDNDNHDNHKIGRTSTLVTFDGDPSAFFHSHRERRNPGVKISLQRNRSFDYYYLSPNQIQKSSSKFSINDDDDANDSSTDQKFIQPGQLSMPSFLNRKKTIPKNPKSGGNDYIPMSNEDDEEDDDGDDEREDDEEESEYVHIDEGEIYDDNSNKKNKAQEKSNRLKTLKHSKSLHRMSRLVSKASNRVVNLGNLSTDQIQPSAASSSLSISAAALKKNSTVSSSKSSSSKKSKKGKKKNTISSSPSRFDEEFISMQQQQQQHQQQQQQKPQQQQQRQIHQVNITEKPQSNMSDYRQSIASSHVRRSPLEGNSLFIFSPKNPLRLWFCDILTQPYVYICSLFIREFFNN